MEEITQEAILLEVDRAKALADHLEISVDEIEEECENNFEAEGCAYMVLTDDEAEEAWDESLENFIEECVLPEIYESYRKYFDNEAFKDDCKYDGRGHSLSGYDGEEHEVHVNGTNFYIYRTN